MTVCSPNLTFTQSAASNLLQARKVSTDFPTADIQLGPDDSGDAAPVINVRFAQKVNFAKSAWTRYVTCQFMRPGA